MGHNVINLSSINSPGEGMVRPIKLMTLDGASKNLAFDGLNPSPAKEKGTRGF